jgi:hypothetical protein
MHLSIKVYIPALILKGCFDFLGVTSAISFGNNQYFLW